MSQRLFVELYRQAPRGGKGTRHMRRAARAMARRKGRRDGKAELRKEA